MASAASRRRGQAIVIALVAPLLSTADVLTTPSLADHAHYAETIALVQVVTSRPVEVIASGATLRCGHDFTAVVLDSLKGASAGTSIEFFSDYDVHASDASGRFLVIARKQSPETRGAVLAAVNRLPPGKDREIARCFARSERHARASDESLMVPVASELDNRPDGPWFERTGGSLLRRDDFTATKIDINGTPSEVVSWSEVKRVFLREIARE